MGQLLSLFLLFGASLFFVLGFFVDAVGYAVLTEGAFDTVLPWDVQVSDVIAIAFTLAKVLFCAMVAWATERQVQAPILAISLLRAGVLINSLAITVLVLSQNLVAPNLPRLEAAYERDIDTVERTSVARADADFNRTRTALAEELAQETLRLDTFYAPRIEAAEAERRAQMDIGGQSFKGAKYKEFDALIASLREEWTARMEPLRSRIATARKIATERHAAEIAAAREIADTARVAGLPDGLRDDTAAQNPHLVRMSHLAGTVAGDRGVEPIVVGIVLTLLLSLLIEFTPLVMLTFGLRLAFAQPAAKISGWQAEANPAPRIVPIAAE